MRRLIPTLSLGSLSGLAIGLTIAGLDAPGSHVLAIAGCTFVVSLAILVSAVLSE